MLVGRDIFYDGRGTNVLTVSCEKYPLTKIQLCDYIDLKNEGCRGTIFSGKVDVRLLFPLPRFFLYILKTKH